MLCKSIRKWWGCPVKERISFIEWKPDLEDFGSEHLEVADNVLHDAEGYKATRTMNTGTALFTDTNIAVTALAARVYESVQGFGNVPLPNSLADDIGYIPLVVYTDAIRCGALDDTTTQIDAGYIATVPPASTFSSTSLQSFDVCEPEDYAFVTTRWHSYVVTGTPQNTTSACGYFARGSSDYGATFTSVNVLREDSGTTPPGVCANVGQFVMVGSMGEVVKDRCAVQWSAIGDPTDWPTPSTDDARAKQSGRQYLSPEFGEVTAIGGDDFFAYVFQQTGITKATYVGGDVVFAFDAFEESRGCYLPNRMTRIDDMFFFESKTGRHMLQGDQITDIGYGVVDDTYPPDLTFGAMVAHNEALKTIFFTNGVCYNYKTGQFTRVSNITPIFSTNDADAIIGQYTTSGTTFSLTNSDGGTAQTATIETSSDDKITGGRTVITGVRPYINGGTTTIQVGIQDALSDSVSYSTAASLNSRSGMANFRDLSNIEGRFVRTRYTITGGFTTAQGADIVYQKSGDV